MLSPKKIVDGIHIKDDLRKYKNIIDLGAGSGSFTFPILARADRDNNVIAVDIDKEMLQKIKDHSIIGGYKLETVLQNIEDGLVFKDNFADFVFAANLLHQIENKDQTIKEIHRILKPGSQALIIDWLQSSRFGPKPENRIDLENFVEKLKNYFIIKDEIDAGSYHFGILLQKR